MKKYYIVHHLQLERWEPLAANSTLEEVEKLFIAYKNNGYDRFLEVSEEVFRAVNSGKEINL